jgi:hypothetical protein
LPAAEPSAAQKSAGNYPKHHVNVRGLRISIENPAGSTRSGTDRDGNEWSQQMQHHYGYIRGTTGKDKDHLDVFLGPEPHAAHPVHVVNQVNEDGEFDEHKIMLGFKSKKDAVEAYHANYEEGWRGADTVATMAFPKFRQWATSSAKRAPARDIGKVEEPEAFQAGGLVKAANALETKLVKAGLFDKKLGAVPATAENATALPRALQDAAKELGLYEEILASGSNRPRTQGDNYSAWAFEGKDVPNTYGYANDVWGARRGLEVQRDTPRLDLFVADPDRRVVAPEGVFDWARPKDMAREFAAEPRVLFRDVRDMDGAPVSAERAEKTTTRQTQHLIPNLERAIDMGAVYPVGRPRGQQGYAAGGSLTPLTNLGGYMYGASSAYNPLSPAATAALIGAPGSDLGSGDAALGSSTPGGSLGGVGLGTIGTALGVAGQLSGTPELGLLGGAVGAVGAAQNGNLGPAGGLIGGLLGGPVGGVVGSLGGQAASGTLSGTSIANALLGAAVPGYGLANGLSGGALGAGLFGGNGGWNSQGVHSQASPGLLGLGLGLSAGTTAVNAANNVASQTNMDPMTALMGVTGGFGTAAGINTSGQNSGAVPGGPEDNSPGFGGSAGGFSDAGGYGAAASDALGAVMKRGGSVGYQVGGLVKGGALAAALRQKLAVEGMLHANTGLLNASEPNLLRLNEVLADFKTRQGVENTVLLSGSPFNVRRPDRKARWMFDDTEADNIFRYTDGSLLDSSRPPPKGGALPSGEVFLVADPKRKIPEGWSAHPQGLSDEDVLGNSPKLRQLESPLVKFAVEDTDTSVRGDPWNVVLQTQYFTPNLSKLLGNVDWRGGPRVPELLRITERPRGQQGYADGGVVDRQDMREPNLAAFGFYPQLGRRKPANNDRTAAANMPLSAARGWLAGTLGLPGDLESLGRAALGAVTSPDSYAGRNMSTEASLPTTEFYNEWLPFRAEGAGNRLAEGAGNFFGGAGATKLAAPVVGLGRGAMEIAAAARRAAKLTKD